MEAPFEGGLGPEGAIAPGMEGEKDVVHREGLIL
jgi:hypothetical protein